MIAARREEHGVPPKATRYLEAEDVAVEREGTIQVRHREVDVADASAGVNSHHRMNVREFQDVAS
jgi:hypothetical protein